MKLGAKRSKNIQDRRAWDGANFGPYAKNNNVGKRDEIGLMTRHMEGQRTGTPNAGKGDMTVPGIDRVVSGTEEDADKVTNKKRF